MRKEICWMLVTVILCLCLTVVGLRLYELKKELWNMRKTVDRVIDELYYPGMWLFLDDEPTENVEAYG